MRFAFRGLRVLMYHKVSASQADALTVTTAQLAEQLAWLRAKGFRFTTIASIIASLRGECTLGGDAVLVTFDDAYRDTGELAWPILRAQGVPAAVFVPTAYMGATSSWDTDARPIMNADELRALVRDGVELGLHSHAHENYERLAPAARARDLDACRATLAGHGLPFAPALAYPFGRRPRGDDRRVLHEQLRAAGIPIAFRIGNRINRLPLRDPYEINRLDIRGDRDFAAFQRKIRWGRWW